jgi:hypothetical protein
VDVGVSADVMMPKEMKKTILQKTPINAEHK